MRHFPALVAAVLLAGCSAGTSGTPSPAPATATPPQPSAPRAEPHRLEIKIDGTAVLTSLTYTIDGKATEDKDVKLPWSHTFTFAPHTGKHVYDVVMRSTGGEVTATATVDGQPWGQSRGSGDGASTQSLDGDFSD
ncbi:hypothetical protein [Amycolatopsis australiensis]|uniref:Uncharacterized protein n=1 Tax=Amycolatopsis australiensis TaxID=546364 RepID=A0A1K1T6L9_9PSEU|nr:hypothetical protein [Amycolatopsis australiensis]SFW91677.1 hypothetical protein SAMN04489730_8088 [Amycolatopsis australiensis]